jgi:hypothetical protein
MTSMSCLLSQLPNQRVVWIEWEIEVASVVETEVAEVASAVETEAKGQIEVKGELQIAITSEGKWIDSFQHL